MNRPRLEPGDRVTCKYAVEAYYGEGMFRPGMVGTVVMVTPKVRIVRPPGDPRYDGCQDFVVVDYVDDNGQLRRTGLNFCNVKRVVRACS